MVSGGDQPAVAAAAPHARTKPRYLTLRSLSEPEAYCISRAIIINRKETAAGN
jgi:hypothetical protein